MKRAFTLVEILAVLAIIGIMIGISVPSFRAFLDKEPLEQAISDVEALCRLARAEAIVNQRSMDVVFNDADETVALTIAPRVVTKPDDLTGEDIQATEEAREIDHVELLADLEIIDPEQEEGRVLIRFYPNGTSESLQVRVSTTEGAYLLTLDPVTGHARVTNDDP